jgi:hypothetical protein
MNRSLKQLLIYISLRDEGRLTTSDNPSHKTISRDSRDDGRRLSGATAGDSFSSIVVDAFTSTRLTHPNISRDSRWGKSWPLPDVAWSGSFADAYPIRFLQ